MKRRITPTPGTLKQPPLIRLLRSPLLRDSRWIGAAAGLLPGGSLLAWAHFVEPRRLEVTHHTHPLGEATPPITLLHLSDLHFITDDIHNRRLVEKLQTLPCDLVVLTGDLVHRGADLSRVVHLLRHLPHPRLGIYTSVGNWDRWCGASFESWLAMLQDAQIEVLLNRWIPLPVSQRSIALVGLDDPLSGEPDLGVLRSVPHPFHRLVLCHTPGFFPTIAAVGADLVLCGHTHGGQVRLPFSRSVWMPAGSGPFDQGWFQARGTHLFVNRGIGMSVAPVRFLCRPEAALIQI